MAISLYPALPVLVVDDDETVLKSFVMTLKSGGINHITRCSDSREAMPLLARQETAVILMDLSMPFVTGEDLLAQVAMEYPELPVIIITGDNELDTAVRCMRNGASDYIVKPVEKSRLLSSVRKAIELRELKAQNEILRERILTGRLAHPKVFSSILTNNRAMLSLFQYIESIAVSPQPVLISGETGVGKELVAAAVHRVSGRSGELVLVNAAGIDGHIFSDTLFGHVKGAYTGADQVRKGMVEKAVGGTLVLDEIGDLQMDSQVKLLRLAQEREYLPLGSDITRTSNARIIASTNCDLRAMVDDKTFRKDLYYRLKTHHLNIPPLRERLDDIPLLLDHFLAEAATSLKKEVPAYPKELVTLLTNYHFPGNVRELRTMIYDAMSVHESHILSTKRFMTHIDSERRQMGNPEIRPEKPAALSLAGTLPTLKQATRELIDEAMRRADNNQSMAARLIGVSRQTLARHLNSDAS